MAACAAKKRKGQASADLSTASQSAAMCTACRDYAGSPPPIPAFWLAQNLASQQTAPTDITCGQSCMTSTHVIGI